MKNQEAKFENYVMKHLSDPGWALSYLKAGLPADLNLNGFLTPEIFQKYFYVDRPNDSTFRNLINNLFDDENHNLLCIESDRGSGKSTFVHMLHLQYDPNHNHKHPFPCIDFSKRELPHISMDSNEVKVLEPYRYCENEIYRVFRKRYRQACKNTAWIAKFYDLLNCITDEFAGYRQSEGYMDTLREARNCANEKEFDQFYKGHSKRIASLRDVDLKVQLLLYLLTFISEPTEPNIRWIIVFDSLEVYVEIDAIRIATVIGAVSDFISAAFESIGIRKDFYTRFTAIFPIRTATSLSFSQYVNRPNQQGKDLWGPGNRYILKLPKFDFASLALLKKIKYLSQIGAKDSDLYNRCVLMASLVMPKRWLDEWIEDGSVTDSPVFRMFTKTRLMPLFNYDFRTIMDRLYDILPKTEDDYIFNSLKMIREKSKSPQVSFDCAANGENMITARLIFDTLHNQRVNLFAEIGYMDIGDNLELGIAKTAFNFLYYSELKFYLENTEQEDWGGEFYGVYFRALLDKLKPFAQHQMTNLARVLYKASILTGDNMEDSLVKDIWAYLIVFKKLSIKLSLNDFRKLIEHYYNNPDMLTEDEEKLLCCEVQLSDAGKSFVVWASKQYEFLLSRSSRRIATYPLFTYSYDRSKDLQKRLERTFENTRQYILEEGINKLINGCLSECAFCEGKSTETRIDCIFCNKLNNSILDCSLFQRYQECLMIIVDIIDYIDRFRVYAFQSGKLMNIEEKQLKKDNEWLVQQISAFNELFEKLKQKVENQFKNTEQVSIFFSRMSNMADNCRKLRVEDDDRITKEERVLQYHERLRIPRVSLWYCDDNKLWGSAIDNIIKEPEIRLFDMIKNSKNVFGKTTESLQTD